MLTREHISLLKYQAEKFPMVGAEGILPFFNQVHALLMLENPQNICFDSTTGQYPYLVTNDSVYEYQCPSNCGRTEGIYRSQVNYVDYDVNLNLPINSNLQLPIDLIYQHGVPYARIQQITSIDAREGANAIVRFQAPYNPGDTTTTYLHRYYLKPTDITSISIQHQIPSPYDMKYLQPGTLKVIEGFQNGTYAEAIEYVSKVLCQRFRADMAGGEQGQSYHVTRNPI